MRLLFLSVLLALSNTAAAAESGRIPQPQFKGVELYSWREQKSGSWRFAMLRGSNRSKTAKEVLAAGDAIDSLPALKARLAELVPGDVVFWLVLDDPPFAIPPPDVVSEIASFVNSEFIDFAAPGTAEITLAPMPHDQAIRLVMAKKQEEVRAIDSAQMAWFDTKERSWSARRPVGPGLIDTTHDLVVVYKIDGVEIASWDVDLRSGSVTRFRP